jgi:GNAT superfamily N-acetyltransferase
VPVAPDPARADRRLLCDADGRTLASFLPGERDGRPLADLVEPADGVPIAAVARQIHTEMTDWKVAGDVALGRALIALGARPTRHAHVHSRDLRRDPAPAEWAEAPGIGPLDATASELLGVYAAAYPPGHVDWLYSGPPADYEADLEGLLDGRIAGPRLDVSRLAVDAAGRPAGALLVTQLQGEPPFGGPWVAELFRRPGDDLRGTGRALLQAGLAVATAGGLPALGLAVTEGNAAQALYESLGFTRVRTSLSVVVG